MQDATAQMAVLQVSAGAPRARVPQGATAQRAGRACAEGARATQPPPQFMSSGLPRTAVPSTIHCDHLIEVCSCPERAPRVNATSRIGISTSARRTRAGYQGGRLVGPEHGEGQEPRGARARTRRPPGRAGGCWPASGAAAGLRLRLHVSGGSARGHSPVLLEGGQVK